MLDQYGQFWNRCTSTKQMGQKTDYVQAQKEIGKLGVQIKRDFRIAKNQLTKQMYLKHFQIQYNIIVANVSPYLS